MQKNMSNEEYYVLITEKIREVKDSRILKIINMFLEKLLRKQGDA